MQARSALSLAIAAYAFSMLSLVGLILFMHDLWLPWTAGSGTLQGDWGRTIAINLGLIVLFGLQHSIMVRPAFKQRLTQIVPEHLERSVYIVASAVALIVLMACWQPMPGVLWHITWQPFVTACLILLGLGGVIAVWSTFLTDHFELFGLRQAYLHDKGLPYTPVPFKMGILYRYVRHPHDARHADPVLDHALHDRRSSVPRRRADGLHPDRRALRGTRSDAPSGIGLRALPRNHADAVPPFRARPAAAAALM